MMTPNFKSLENKVVAVTGGGGVICSTLAIAIARQGAKVAVLDLIEAAATKISDAIKAEGGESIGIAVDVLNKDSLLKAQDKIRAQLGSCDILINGAGGNHPKGTTTKNQLFVNDIGQKDLQTFFDLDIEGIKFVFDLNFLGTLLPTQVFAADMINKEGCAILNISSMNAYRPLTKIPAYSGAKAAVSNFTQWLSVHFAPVNIRVNAIAPGFFLTAQNEALLTQEDGSLTQRGQTIIDHTPMNRFGEPEDLIGTTLWLISNQSGFVTGVVIPIDGGFSAFSGV